MYIHADVSMLSNRYVVGHIVWGADLSCPFQQGKVYTGMLKGHKIPKGLSLWIAANNDLEHKSLYYLKPIHLSAVKNE